MFSVYGKAGRIFRGSLEELRGVAGVARTRAVAAIGLDPLDHSRAQVLQAQAAAAPVDVAHRVALGSYAHTAQQDHVRQPLTQVGAIMHSPVVTLLDTATVEQAWHTLAQHHVGQAPVVDANGILVGLLSRAELMAPERLPGPESHALVWRALLMQSVVDLMWSPVPSVSAGTDIRRLARVLLDTGLPGLPVVDEAGLVIGFASRSDILRAVVADPPLDLWT
ncbi:MAG: histidine kinase [Burkholderiales bacterium PBB4]|nr:MAG: histidine kinase [Burkholderiales bacterium PBB4]